MEAEEKELAKIGTEIKPWTLNDEDKNIVGKTLFGVITNHIFFNFILEFFCRVPRFPCLFVAWGNVVTFVWPPVNQKIELEICSKIYRFVGACRILLTNLFGRGL
jgi:hypothetical protein